MTALRPFHPTDLFKTNLTNLDTLTENYELRLYLEYLAKWPFLFNLIEGQRGEINAYSMPSHAQTRLPQPLILTLPPLVASNGQSRRTTLLLTPYTGIHTMARPHHRSDGCTAVSPVRAGEALDRVSGAGE